MKRRTSIAALVLLTLASFNQSCSDSSASDGDIAALKKEKDSLHSVKQDISSRINEIEEELKLLDTSGTKNLPVVTVSDLKIASFRHYFKVQGVVQTDQNATINAEVAAKIMNIKVGEGEKVRKGQVLMELDSRVLRNNIEEVKTQIDLARTVYEKQKALWDQNIGSEIQYLEAKTNKESLERKLQTMMAQLEYYMIQSPFDGIVDEIFPKVGETAAPGIPLIRVMNLENIYLKADVSEGYLGKIKVGDTSYIEFPGMDMKIESSISRIGRYINPNNRSFKIRFELDNKDQRLIPNQLAVVNVLDYVSPVERIIIPTKLLQETPSGEDFVFVLHENGEARAQKILITTGLSYRGEIEVLEGLEKGDKIIMEGARGIKDGEIIEISSN